MFFPFTPDEIDLVSMLPRSRHLAGNPVEEIEPDVPPDPESPGTLAGPQADPISRQPRWEVHHSEGVFLAHRG